MEKNIIVTGGAKGIGRGIVEALAKEHHHIILNYYHSEQEAISIKEELSSNGYDIRIYKADVSKRDQVKGLVEFAIKELGTIDVLINNAGIAQDRLFTDITDEDWNNMIQTNLNSVFYMTQEVTRHMIKNQNGSIINISSIWGMVGASCEVHYSVAKAGVDAMTKSLAKELGLSNIRVNSIAPGMIDTSMNDGYTKEEVEEIRKEIPLQRIGKVCDISKCVEWLVEDMYTTGQIISVNGGWVIT